jgi:L-asparaginase II
MIDPQDAPPIKLTGGNIVESTHYGAIAVVDSHGRLLHSMGDPDSVGFLRSSAKPLRAMPCFEYGGPHHLGLSQRCKSSSGAQRMRSCFV